MTKIMKKITAVLSAMVLAVTALPVQYVHASGQAYAYGTPSYGGKVSWGASSTPTEDYAYFDIAGDSAEETLKMSAGEGYFIEGYRKNSGDLVSFEEKGTEWSQLLTVTDGDSFQVEFSHFNASASFDYVYFDSLDPAYPAQEYKYVRMRNYSSYSYGTTKNAMLDNTNIQVTASGDTSAFEWGKNSLSGSTAPGESADIVKVRPKTGLSAGAYEITFTITVHNSVYPASSYTGTAKAYLQVKGYITDVPITYDTNLVKATTSATGAEVTQALINSLHPDEDDRAMCGDMAYVDARTSFTHLSKKDGAGFASLTGSTEKLNTTDEYYLSFNIEDVSGKSVFDTDHLPNVTINGTAADYVEWNEKRPDGHIQAYKRIYTESGDYCFSVTLSPEKQKVQKGTSFQFTADVLGSVKTLNWSLTGGAASSATRVDNYGRVTVGADETASEFKVRATSTFNPSVYGEATVIVMDEPVGIDSVTISPKTVTMKKGTGYDFNVEVTGTEDHTVEWSISGNDSIDTEIADNGYLYVAVKEGSDTIVVHVESVKDPSKYDEAIVTLTEANYIRTVTITYENSEDVQLTPEKTGKQVSEALIEALHPEDDRADAGEMAYIDARLSFTYLAEKDGDSYKSLRDSTDLLDPAKEYYLSFNIEDKKDCYFDTDQLPDVTVNGQKADYVKWNEIRPDGHLQAYLRVYMKGQGEDHKIYFDPNGGSGSMAPVYVRDKTDYIIPECKFTAPDGKQFDHWAIVEYPGTEWKKDDTLTNVTKDYTLTAQWKQLMPSYEVGLMDFGTAKEGYSSFEYKYLEITNTGDTVLHFDNDYTLSGDTSAFYVTSSMPATVNIGQTRQGIGICPKSGLTSGGEPSKTYTMVLTIQDTDHYTLPMSINVMFTVTSSAYSTITFDTKGKGSPVAPLTVHNGARFNIGEEGDPAYAYYDEKRVIPGGEDNYVFDWWYYDEAAESNRIHYMDTIDEDVTLYARWLPAINIVNVTGCGSIYDGYTTAQYETDHIPNIGPMAAEEHMYDWIEGYGWYTKSGDTFTEFTGTFRNGNVYYLYVAARSSEDYRFACDRSTDEFLVQKYTVNWKPVEPEGIDGKSRVVSFYIPFYLPIVKLNMNSMSVNKGQTKQLTATLVPEKTPYKEIIWYSSDTSTATVDTNGVVKGLKNGNAYIWATAIDDMDQVLNQASCYVTVTTGVSSVKVSPESVTLIKGNTLSLTATVLPSDAGNKEVTWSSDKPEIASVNASGTVTAKDYGNAVITVKTKDGGKTAVCKVFVTSSNPIEAFVIRLYSLCLNRKPDAGGFANWVNKLKTKTATAAEVVQGFFNSKEMANMHLSDSEYIERCYLVMMNRASDAGGKKNWIETKQAGVSNNYILRGFVHSAEFTHLCSEFGIERGTIVLTEPRDQNLGITKFVSRCYSEVLGRKADTGGLNNWCDKILKAADRKQEAINTASDGFFHSPEFIKKNTTNEQYVTILYRTFLGREPDTGGFNNWVAKLNSGTSRDTVLNGFAYSAEFANIMAGYGIN